MRAGREMPLDDTCEIRVENMWIIHQPAPKQSVLKRNFRTRVRESIHDGHHLNFYKLLGFAELQNCQIGRRRLVIVGSEIRVDDRARSSDVPHSGARPEDEDVNDVSEGCSCGRQRLLDPFHTC